MIFAEFLALIAVIGAISAGGVSLRTFIRGANERIAAKVKREAKMQEDLREALASRDYNRIDDWLVMYAADITPILKDVVEARRADLYINSTDKDRT